LPWRPISPDLTVAGGPAAQFFENILGLNHHELESLSTPLPSPQSALVETTNSRVM
jgi:hypothetical protein